MPTPERKRTDGHSKGKAPRDEGGGRETGAFRRDAAHLEEADDGVVEPLRGGIRVGHADDVRRLGALVTWKKRKTENGQCQR